MPLGGQERQMEGSIYMREALKEAEKSYLKDEVPVGAVIVFNNEIIAKAHNCSISKKDPSCHAEIEVIRLAANKLKNYRLNECDLYSTLEPCMMCAGAIVQARIKNLVYAALDPKSGAIESRDNLLEKNYLNHGTNFFKGPLEKESSDLLKKFFKSKRN